jgi:hypothetical protein
MFSLPTYRAARTTNKLAEHRLLQQQVTVTVTVAVMTAVLVMVDRWTCSGSHSIKHFQRAQQLSTITVTKYHMKQKSKNL